MLEGFCEYLRRQGKSENTVKAYCQGMKEYMRWHEETFGKRMKMFLRANVLDYISYLRTVKGLSNRSVNAKLASLHSFNLYLIAAGYTKEVVLDKQDYLKVQLAYAIGVAEPVSVRVDSFGTGVISDEAMTELLRKTCDMTPGGIIRKLNLRRPIYKDTAMTGHFGVENRPWEATDLADQLKELAKSL